MDPNDSETVQLKSGSKRYEGVNGDGMGCEGIVFDWEDRISRIEEWILRRGGEFVLLWSRQEVGKR